MSATTCPRRMDEAGPWEMKEGLDSWQNRDGVDRCSFCGSIHPDAFMAMTAGGAAEVEPTDKNYKAYIKADGLGHAKFYYQHLSAEQRTEFVRRMNAGEFRLAYPGRFYQLPFFVTRG
jgi:hypothetical protein